MVVAYWDSFACKVAQSYAIHEVLDQKNNAVTTPAENALLAEVLLEVAGIESRAADTATSSRCRLASDKLRTGRRTSSATHVSRPT